jgi:hypothetical protein
MLWLGILGFMLGAAALSVGITLNAGLLLLALFGAAVIGSMLEWQPAQLIDRSRSSLTAMRMSSEARDAVERARRRGGLIDSGITLLDVGLITSQNDQDGLTMRRTREASLDEDGVRPYIQLHIQPHYADRPVRIRFDMIDQNGQRQYVHEMRTMLRDGEMNVLADHHLPLRSGGRGIVAGDWDLRVSIDGALFAAHTFMLVPSTAERVGRLQRDQAPSTTRPPVNPLTDDDARMISGDDAPMSLEDLLRSRGQNNNQQSSSSP